MDDLQSLWDDAEPRPTEAQRDKVMREFVLTSRQADRRSARLMLMGIVAVNVLAPIAVLLLIVLAQPAQIGMYLVIGLLALAVLPMVSIRRVRLRHRLRFAREMVAAGFRPGVCPACGYPWRGLDRPRCPECGVCVDEDVQA
ncbi:MAG: hypothetical protein ACPGYV_01850 [Phycisphaeraceae bacterium]